MSETTDEELWFSLHVQRPGREDKYDSPEEFEQGVGGDLRSIEQIYISARPKNYSDARVSVVVVFYRGDSGAWMKTEGTSEVSVRGVALALQAVLDQGRRRARWMLWIAVALGGCSAVLTVLVLLGLGEHGKNGSHTVNNVLSIVALILCAISLLGIALFWVAVRGMEVRRVGEPTRLERLLGRPGRWLLGALAIAVISALATKLAG